MFTGQRMRESLGVSDTHRMGTSLGHRAEGEAWPTLLEAGVCFDVAIAYGCETQKPQALPHPRLPRELGGLQPQTGLLPRSLLL